MVEKGSYLEPVLIDNIMDPCEKEIIERLVGVE